MLIDIMERTSIERIVLEHNLNHLTCLSAPELVLSLEEPSSDVVDKVCFRLSDGSHITRLKIRQQWITFKRLFDFVIRRYLKINKIDRDRLFYSEEYLIYIGERP